MTRLRTSALALAVLMTVAAVPPVFSPLNGTSFIGLEVATSLRARNIEWMS